MAQDILKILYASEDEKVKVSADGQLQITGINAPEVVPQPDNEVAGDEDEMMI